MCIRDSKDLASGIETAKTVGLGVARESESARGRVVEFAPWANVSLQLVA